MVALLLPLQMHELPYNRSAKTGISTGGGRVIEQEWHIRRVQEGGESQVGQCLSNEQW